MQNKRVLDYASALDKYYLWLTGESDPPSFDGIYDGFSHFLSPIALMKAISYLHQQNTDQFRSNFAFAAHKPVKGSKTSVKLKLQANKYSNTVPTLNEVRYMLTKPDITETL